MVALWLTRRLLSPLRSLKQGIEKLSDGEYEHRIVVNRTDELGLIAEEFNVLAEESPVVMTNLQVNSEAFSTASNLQPLAKCQHRSPMNCEIP